MSCSILNSFITLFQNLACCLMHDYILSARFFSHSWLMQEDREVLEEYEFEFTSEKELKEKDKTRLRVSQK